MEWIADPTAWLGLLTLIVLELVLGIDNLVFIAILADKLPPEQRDRARVIGLTLALVMRLGLLASISWMVTLTQPLFEVFDKAFSGRDLIMLFGGLFLLFVLVATTLFRVDETQQVIVTRLGKPARITPFELKGEVAYDWRYLEPPNTHMVFTVYFDRDYRVLRTGSVVDPDQGGGGSK